MNPVAHIDSLTHEGAGVARIDGKVTFIDGALPGETVEFRYIRRTRKHDEGTILRVIEASPDRVEPRCAHFGVCGGCVLQHLSSEAQVGTKARILFDTLAHVGGVEPGTRLPALTEAQWGYRRKARLGIKYVKPKGRALIGFRERNAHFLADLARCEILRPELGERLTELSRLVTSLEARARIPQIEAAVGDDSTVLAIRNLDPLSVHDREKLVAWAKESDIHLMLQPGGPDSLEALWPEKASLEYRLPEFDVALRFTPLDFVQVHAGLNRRMVALAIELLNLRPEYRVLDLYCGLGNFTLPLARRAAHVTGVEGSEVMVERARANACHNGIGNVEFHAANLLEPQRGASWLQAPYDRILIDPPRAGAKEILDDVARLRAERIVYVSCNPATLARDAGELVHNHGYRLEAAGVMDMFPHTAHIESIALFLRG